MSSVSFLLSTSPARQRAGIVDGRTGTQFLHLRSPHHGTLGCSTVGRAEHCSGMECVRISYFAEPLQLLRSKLFWISIFCSSHRLPFSYTLHREPVAIRGSLLCASLLQSRFHLGTTSSRGAVERFRQGSECDRPRLSGTPKGQLISSSESQTPQKQSPGPPRNTTAVSSGPGSRVTLTATMSNDMLDGSKRRTLERLPTVNREFRMRNRH